MPKSETTPPEAESPSTKGNKKRRKEQFTRREILKILKQDGPQDSKTLAEQLGVTAMGVRQHLYALKDEAYIAFTEESRPMGRPAKLWELTPAADKFFPDSNSTLLVDMLGHVSNVFGEEGLGQLINKRAESQLVQYQERMKDNETLEGRIKVLVEIRSEEGYMAEMQRHSDGSFSLIENHCPICVAAQTCQQFCNAELHLFESLLGPQVKVQRGEHILSNSRRCVYTITEE